MARLIEREKQDKNGEKAVHLFLKNIFYPYVTNYVECNDKDIQFLGIDTSFIYNGFVYQCDEKAALDYTNKQKGCLLNTFCLELSFLNRKDEEMEGWFTKDGNISNSYLFVWVDKSEKNVITSPNEIEEAEIMLIQKSDIFDYLKTIGWDKTKLRKKNNQIRYCGDRNFGSFKENGCKISYAEYLPEKPINLLLTREVYSKMPHTIRQIYKK